MRFICLKRVYFANKIHEIGEIIELNEVQAKNLAHLIKTENIEPNTGLVEPPVDKQIKKRGKK